MFDSRLLLDVAVFGQGGINCVPALIDRNDLSDMVFSLIATAV